MEAPAVKVDTLLRRISARQAEYEATHAAWERNRERWTLLEEETDDRRRAECRVESVRLDARCRALNARIKVLHGALWRAECEAAERTSNIEHRTSFHAKATNDRSNSEVEEKISPPGRAACAESGCLKEPVSFSTEERGVLTLATGGNRAGMVQIRNPKSEIRNEEDGRAGA